MQKAKSFFLDVIRILNFLISLLSLLTVVRAAVFGERQASPAVREKEIRLGRTAVSSIYACFIALSVVGLITAAVLLVRRAKD